MSSKSNKSKMLGDAAIQMPKTPEEQAKQIGRADLRVSFEKKIVDGKTVICGTLGDYFYMGNEKKEEYTDMEKLKKELETCFDSIVKAIGQAK